MPSLLSLSPQRFWLTQSPQEMSTGGMEREEEGEENKGDLRWVTCKSVGMIWGSGEVGRKECSEGEVQVSGIPPPDEHHHFPPPGTSTTQKTCLKKKKKKRLVLTAGGSRRGRGRHLHGLGRAEQAAVVPSPDPPGCPRAGRLSTACLLGRQSGVAMTWVK